MQKIDRPPPQKKKTNHVSAYNVHVMPRIHCDQLILRKISKIVPQILKLKCTKFDFRLGSAHTPRFRSAIAKDHYSQIP